MSSKKQAEVSQQQLLRLCGVLFSCMKSLPPSSHDFWAYELHTMRYLTTFCMDTGLVIVMSKKQNEDKIPYWLSTSYQALEHCFDSEWIKMRKMQSVLYLLCAASDLPLRVGEIQVTHHMLFTFLCHGYFTGILSVNTDWDLLNSASLKLPDFYRYLFLGDPSCWQDKE